MDRIEKLQGDYTKLIPEIRNLTYEDRLKAFKVTSIQRRFERYKILYIYKILNGTVPNCGLWTICEKIARGGINCSFLGHQNPKLEELKTKVSKYLGPDCGIPYLCISRICPVIPWRNLKVNWIVG